MAAHIFISDQHWVFYRRDRLRGLDIGSAVRADCLSCSVSSIPVTIHIRPVAFAVNRHNLSFAYDHK